jgi:hypothetical protein
MSERDWIEPIVERVVTQVLESHTAQLRTEIVRRVMEEVAAQPAAAPAAPAGADSAELARVVVEIQSGSSQKEILRALLDGCIHYASRVALFVVKAGHASGWQGRGFSRGDALKDFSLDANAPAVARAIADRAPVTVQADQNDSRFVTEFSAPANGEGRFLPLLLKDKVAALVYADGGSEPGGHLDAGSLELLVLSTSAWLEVSSLRKQVHKEHAPEAASERVESRSAPPVQTVPAFNDPFAAHAPIHAMAAAASAETPTPAMSAAAPAPAVEEAPRVASPAIETSASAAEPLPEVTASAPVPAPQAPAASAEDQEIHRKAQRFARLLVDEIKLYNQAKVSEGRRNKDLYDRLKEAIEKSRATYQKRYGNTVAASGDYFQHEVVRSLAEDDISIMGANFRH